MQPRLYFIPVLATVAAVLWFSVGLAQTEVALVRVDAPSEPVPRGSDFSVDVVVDDVANLASFQFTLLYDPETMIYQGLEEGPFLGSSGRDVLCLEPVVGVGSIRSSCVTTSPPRSLGGPAGPSGSGVLATVTFSPRQAGEAQLELQDVILVLDDLDANEEAVPIPNRTQNGVVELLGAGGDGFNWVLWAPIIAVGAAVVLGAVVALGGLGFGAGRRGRRDEGGPTRS